MSPLLLVDEIFPVCHKACLDTFHEHPEFIIESFQDLNIDINFLEMS